MARHWLKAEKEGRVLIGRTIAEVEFENNYEAQIFETVWENGQECKLYMLGAVCMPGKTWTQEP